MNPYEHIIAQFRVDRVFFLYFVYNLFFYIEKARHSLAFHCICKLFVDLVKRNASNNFSLILLGQGLDDAG